MVQFNGAAAEALEQELRGVFATGKTKKAEWRLQQLQGLVRFTEERKMEIAEALYADLKKPAMEAIYAEVTSINFGGAAAAAQLKTWMAAQKVSAEVPPHLSRAEIKPEPLGVVLIIAPWNFPVALSLDPMIGAVAAGNAVVLKPSELSPASSALMAKYLPQYLDPSAIRVIEGGVPETRALLEQKWDKIFYTGSARVGRIVMAAAAQHLTPVTLELGGKSPTIVDSAPDLEMVAKKIIMGKWGLNFGQVCISPDYILAKESLVHELVEKLKSVLKQFYGEDPSLSPDLARIINGNHFEHLVGLLSDKDTSNKMVLGGHSKKDILYIEPTLVLNPSVNSKIMQEEIFGPLLPIISVKDVDEAIRFVNSRPKPLALYVFTADKDVAERVVEETSSGGVTVNDTASHVTHPGLPFGGVGESGMGAYHGKFSFDTFSHMKAIIYEDPNESRVPMYPPYSQT